MPSTIRTDYSKPMNNKPRENKPEELKELQSPEVRELQSLRDNHVGRLFLRAHRDFAARSITKLRARGHERLTLAHTALLPHLDLKGTSVSILAERADMTKQSMAQLVGDLEANGYVERRRDPNDRRATLVSFTEEGWRFLRDAHEVKQEVYAEYLALLGTERLDALESALRALVGPTRPDLT